MWGPGAGSAQCVGAKRDERGNFREQMVPLRIYKKYRTLDFRGCDKTVSSGRGNMSGFSAQGRDEVMFGSMANQQGCR